MKQQNFNCIKRAEGQIFFDEKLKITKCLQGNTLVVLRVRFPVWVGGVVCHKTIKL